MLARLLDDPDPDIGKAVIDALVHLDPTGLGTPAGKHRPKNLDTRNAVPALIQVIKGRDTELRVAANHALRGWVKTPAPLSRRCPPPWATPTALRRAAAETLGELGPVALDAVPDLSLAAKDPDANVRKTASDALLRIAGLGQP